MVTQTSTSFQLLMPDHCFTFLNCAFFRKVSVSVEIFADFFQFRGEGYPHPRFVQLSEKNWNMKLKKFAHGQMGIAFLLR